MLLQVDKVPLEATVVLLFRQVFLKTEETCGQSMHSSYRAKKSVQCFSAFLAQLFFPGFTDCGVCGICTPDGQNCVGFGVLTTPWHNVCAPPDATVGLRLTHSERCFITGLKKSLSPNYMYTGQQRAEWGTGICMTLELLCLPSHSPPWRSPASKSQLRVPLKVNNTVSHWTSQKPHWN